MNWISLFWIFWLSLSQLWITKNRRPSYRKYLGIRSHNWINKTQPLTTFKVFQTKLHKHSQSVCMIPADNCQIKATRIPVFSCTEVVNGIDRTQRLFRKRETVKRKGGNKIWHRKKKWQMIWGWTNGNGSWCNRGNILTISTSIVVIKIKVKQTKDK